MLVSNDCTQMSSNKSRSSVDDVGDDVSLLLLLLVDRGELLIRVLGKLGVVLFSSVEDPDGKSLDSWLLAPAGINMNGRELLLSFLLLVTTTT